VTKTFPRYVFATCFADPDYFFYNLTL